MTDAPTLMADADGPGLSGPSWRRFVGEFWRRHPVRIRSPGRTPMATPADAFVLLRSAAADVAEGRDVPLMVAARTGDRTGRERLRYLPNQDDARLENYKRRVRHESEAALALLILYGCHCRDRPLWRRVRAFLAGLYARVGLPSNKADTELFFGHYDATPGGIHRDEVENFAFVIEGEKTVLLWPRDTFSCDEARLQRHDYETFLHEAIVLRGEAGDILYWPRDYWHIAVGGGERWQSMLNISLYTHGQPALGFSRAALDVEICRHGLEDAPPMYRTDRVLAGAQTSMPEILDRELAALRALVAGPEADSAIRRHWLRHVTGYGFAALPPPHLDVEFDPGAVVSMLPGSSILWMPGGAGEDLIGADGYTFRVRSEAGIRQIVALLNEGGVVQIEHLLDRVADGGNAPDLRDRVAQLIGGLAAVGALEVRTGNGTDTANVDLVLLSRGAAG